MLQNNTMVHLEMGLHVVLVSFPAAATVKDSITDRTLIRDALQKKNDITWE